MAHVTNIRTRSVHCVEAANSPSLDYQDIAQGMVAWVATPDVAMGVAGELSGGGPSVPGPAAVSTPSGSTPSNKPAGKSKKKAIGKQTCKAAEPSGVPMPGLQGLPVKERPAQHRVSTLTRRQETGDG